MQLSFSKKIIYGAVILGVGFPIIGILITLNSLSLGFSISNIISVHQQVPAIFLIDLAPLVLPIVAWYVSILAEVESAKAVAQDENLKVQSINEIITQLGNGNYDVNCQVNGAPIIGNKLEEFKLIIKQNKSIEDQRIWESEGLANFAETLRNNNEDLTQMCQIVIQKIVKYVDAHFGGLYILDDSRKTHLLKLTGSYAYDFSVKKNQSFEVGEGLVGQSFKKNEFIYLTKIPESYEYKIESGLGDLPPKSIIFVPLTANETTVGVVEVASLNEMQTFQIDFIKKLCESIAISIVNVKTNQTTKDLLEESQFMSQQLQAQEEELRQNAEELQATQEEIERKLSETENVLTEERKKINAIVSTSSDGIILISEKGVLLEFNPAFQELLGYTKTDFKNINLSKILSLETDVLNFLTKNLNQIVEKQIKTKNNDEIWVKASINKIEMGNTINYSVFISDISELKHNVNVMEETVTEFQHLMMEQAETQSALEMELEQTKAELEKFKNK